MTELESRFTSHVMTEPQQRQAADLRVQALELANQITDVVPDTRERSLSLTKLEEVVFWAIAGLARHGI